MKVLLSSRATFICKFVLPLLWSVYFGLLTLSVGGANDSFWELPFQRGCALVWSVGTALLIWASVPVKRVSIDYDEWTLCVSNFLSQTTVPLEEIIKVYEQGLSQQKFIVIELRSPAAFGKRIVFMPASKPPSALTCGLNSVSILEELQIIAERNCVVA